MISAGLGRFGPYIKHDGKFVSLKAGDDVLTVGMNRAVALLAEAAEKKGGGGAEPIRTLGAHPEGGGDINVYSGKHPQTLLHKGAGRGRIKAVS